MEEVGLEASEWSVLASAEHVRKKKLKPREVNPPKAKETGKYKTSRTKSRTHRTKRRKKRSKRLKDPFQEQELELQEELPQQVQEEYSSLADLEQQVIHTRTELIRFYTKHKPANVNEEVLAILLQFFVDCGDKALNQKLRKTYGEDLHTFNKTVPMKLAATGNSADLSNSVRSSMNNALRHTLQRNLSEDGLDFLADSLDFSKPEIKTEVNLDASIRSLQSLPQKSDKKKHKDVEKYKRQKQEQMTDLEKDLHKHFFGLETKQPQPNALLDGNEGGAVEEFDLLEAFYSQNHPSKLLDADAMTRITHFAIKKGMGQIDKKLGKKYGVDTTAYVQLAKRRKNARFWITRFYKQYDEGRLGDKYKNMFTKLVDVSIDQGVEYVNREMDKVYGHKVFPL